MAYNLTKFGEAIREMIWAETGNAGQPTIEARAAHLEKEILALVRAEMIRCHVLIDTSNDV